MGVVVFRMMNVLKGIGRSDGLRLWSDIHDVLNAEESIKSIKLDDMPYAFGARALLGLASLPSPTQSPDGTRSSTDVANHNPKNLFTTITRDLCGHDPEYKTSLWQVVKDDRSLRTSQSPLEQIEALIVKPCKDLHPVGPLVVVTDALDESGDPASRQHILRAISKHITENSLLTHLRFLITTCPEEDILAELPTGPRVNTSGTSTTMP